MHCFRTARLRTTCSRGSRTTRIADAAEIAGAGTGAASRCGARSRGSRCDARPNTTPRGGDGVDEVINHLQVNLPGADRRQDDEIRGAALQNLIRAAELRSDSLDVKVPDGWVALTGEVSFQFHSDAAYDDGSRPSGVTGVTNEITVTNP
jgi:osmotically-inducible protein OsmY